MLKILPVLIAFSFSSPTYAGTPEETLSAFGFCKFNSIPRMLTSSLGTRVQAPMTGANHGLYGQLFRALDAGDSATVSALNTSMGLRGCKFSGDQSNVLFFYSKAEGLAFLWRMGAMRVPGDSSTVNNPVDPLILEVLGDNVWNMQRTSGKIFADTHARVMVINPVRRNWLTMVNYPMGDSSLDADATLAGLASHIELLKLYPSALYIQEYATVDVGILVVNGLHSHNDRCKSGPRLMMDAVPEFLLETQYNTLGFCKKGVLDGPADCIKGSIQTSSRACPPVSADRGRLIQLELGKNFRGPKAGGRIQNLIGALNQTMESWVSTK